MFRNIPLRRILLFMVVLLSDLSVLSVVMGSKGSRDDDVRKRWIIIMISARRVTISCCKSKTIFQKEVWHFSFFHQVFFSFFSFLFLHILVHTRHLFLFWHAFLFFMPLAYRVCFVPFFPPKFFRSVVLPHRILSKVMREGMTCADDYILMMSKLLRLKVRNFRDESKLSLFHSMPPHKRMFDR